MKKNAYSIEMLLGFIPYGFGLLAINKLFEPSHDDWPMLFIVLPLIYIATVIVRYVVFL